MTTIVKTLLAMALIVGSASSVTAVQDNDPIPHCFPCPQSR